MAFRTRGPRASLLLAVVAALLFLVSPVAGAEDLRPQIERLAQPLIEDGTAVGFVVGVLRDGQTEIVGYGETAKGSKTIPDGDTLFQVGSITKVFTCTLLADMVERGLVKLDDPVQQYLPEGVKMPIAEDRPIKLVDVATHRSGLPRMPDNFHSVDFLNPYADYDEELLHAFLNGHKLRRAPGEFEYSNLAMGLLGTILARRAGTSYEQLLADRITGPLGMNDTRVALDAGRRERLAGAYTGALDPVRPWDFQAMAAAGGISSSAKDMLKFAAANCDDKSPLAKAIRLAQARKTEGMKGPAMGLGWFLADDGATCNHTGMTSGYCAYLAVTPARKFAVVVLCNTASDRATKLGDLVAKAASGQQVEPLPPKKPAAPRQEIAVDLAVLARYVGAYRIPPGTDLTISLEDGKLMAAGDGSKVPLFARSPTEFFLKVVDAEMTFVTDEDGKASKLIIQSGSQRIEAPRKE